VRERSRHFTSTTSDLLRDVAADVLHRVDRSGRDEEDVAGLSVIGGLPSI